MKNLESRFAALAAKVISTNTDTRMPKSLFVLRPIENAGLSNTQRIYIMAAATTTDSDAGLQSSNEINLSALSYKSVVSVIKQCWSTSGEQRRREVTLVAATARMAIARVRMDVISMLKSLCHTWSLLCAKYSRGGRVHKEDGLLVQQLKCIEKHDITLSSSTSNSENKEDCTGELKKSLWRSQLDLSNPLWRLIRAPYQPKSRVPYYMTYQNTQQAVRKISLWLVKNLTYLRTFCWIQY